MENLGKHWAGRLFGTNTGNLFLELEADGEKGVLKFNDTIHKLATYYVTVSQEDESYKISGEPAEDDFSHVIGNITLIFALQSDGTLRGDWASSNGYAGTLDLFPHSHQSSARTSDGIENEQLFATSKIFGSIRLTPENLAELASKLQSEFKTGRVILTFRLNGMEKIRFFEDLKDDLAQLIGAKYLKLSVQEQAAATLNNVAVLELDSDNDNIVRTQGISESWAIGTAEKIANAVKKNEQKLVNLYKKQGLNVNSIIFLALLATIPDLKNLGERVFFMASVFALLVLNFLIHKYAVPHFVILSAEKHTRSPSRLWGPIVSWGSAVTSALVASYLFYLLTQANG